MNKKELELANSYSSIYNDLVTWGAFVDKTLFETVLLPIISEVKIFPLFRVKSQQSFLDKALYRKQGYTDPINQIDDKVGTRVILLKSNDIHQVAELIKQYLSWDAKVTKDINQLIEDKPQIFDYQSMHLVVYPKKGVVNFEHNYQYGCEIQIRTLLQHAYAEVSHDSTYKGPYQFDNGIIRQLSKSMALMESTDDYFLEIYELMADPKRKFAALLKGLVNIYQSFMPDFQLNDLNINLSDRLMLLVTIRDVTIKQIETYVEKHRDQFEKAIKKNNGLLFHQPISILVGYFVLRHNDTIKEHWPLDQNLLKEIFLAFNYSYG
jgi:putative GTP pyrophosphokinase